MRMSLILNSILTLVSVASVYCAVDHYKPADNLSSYPAATVENATTNYTVLTYEQYCDLSGYTMSPRTLIPIYCYVSNEGRYNYSTPIQKEIWKQYHSFEGDLPPYETVLALWIKESGLDPSAVNDNSDGTRDIGIPQLNTDTIAESLVQGWYNPKADDLSDYRVQIRLGLQVLSYYCTYCKGGRWENYRAFRAYRLGITGLLDEEKAGNFGYEDEWTTCADGTTYPGDYGKIKEIEVGLFPIKGAYV